MIISCRILLTMRNVSDRSCRENQNTYVKFIKIFPHIVPLKEIMRKNIGEPDRPQMTIRCLRFACWITKITDSHSEYVILIGFLW